MMIISKKKKKKRKGEMLRYNRSRIIEINTHSSVPVNAHLGFEESDEIQKVRLAYEDSVETSAEKNDEEPYDFVANVSDSKGGWKRNVSPSCKESPLSVRNTLQLSYIPSNRKI
jgi:hypothetical protein